MSLSRRGPGRYTLILALLLVTLAVALFNRSPTAVATDSSSVIVRMAPDAWAGLTETLQPVSLIDYDAYLWLKLDADAFAQLQASGVPYQQQTNPFHLTLAEQTFDPLAGPPQLPAGWEAPTGSGPDFHLVQLQGPTRGDWLDGLKSQNLEIVQYIHPYTYVVWGEAVAQQVQNQPFVRWTGPFAPAYKVLPRWQSLPAEVQPVDVLLYRGADVNTAVSQLEQIGRVYGRTTLDATWEIVGLQLAGDRLQTAATIPGVYAIQPRPTDGGLRGEMSNQINVNNHDGSNLAFPGYATWLTGVGLDGSGVIMANVDGGVQASHPDLINRMLPCTGVTCSGTASSHGTHTAAIMAGDGASGVTDSFGFLRGQGVAPGANLVEQVYNPFYTQPGGMLLLMTESYRNNAILSGNSWGPAGTPRGYDGDTLQVDIGVRDADPDAPGNQAFTYVLSIMNGNGGTSSQGSPDEAKNIFTIGSTKMQNANGSQILDINDLSANTAHGPALDGRKIPHMVAPGCRVDSATTGSGYTLLCGTSMASPHVSGAVALFVEYYRNLHGIDPTPALIKAAFLPVAHDLAGFRDANNGILGHPFDSKQGWGRMDLAAVVDPQVEVHYFDDPFLFLETGEEWVQQVSVVDPTQPLRIMLVWTDAPGHGLGGSTPAWNNDLDLVVEMDDETYLGNQFGSGGWSVPGGTADDRNNTEGVFIGPTASGSATIRVVAANITSDAIPGNGHDADQDFALVCYNCALFPDFSLTAEPTSLAMCVPDDAVYDILVGSMLGFADDVTLSVMGQPAGTTAVFSQNPVTPPGSSLLTIGNTGAAEAGSYALTVTGEAPTSTHTVGIGLHLFTETPGQASLLTPPHAATNQPQRPTFTWETAVQGGSYTLEIARDTAFSDVVHTASGLTATSYEMPTDLQTNTRYYWRVRAENACGTGLDSAVFHFTTLALPGDCGLGTAPITHFFEDFESGAPGWTSGGTGNTWALSQARQHSGDWSYHAVDSASVSDQRLVSPPVELPTDQSPLTLQFWNYQHIESRAGGGCWDGAILEISSDDGTTWDYIEGDKLLTDPYDGLIQSGYSNPLAGLDGWCGDPQPWLRSVAEIDDYAGETVRFRFRLGTDSIVGREGWYIDDLRVQSCAASYNAYLTPNSSGEVMPEESVYHTFTLENLGLDDSYELSLTDHTWPTSLLTDSPLVLNSGGTATVTVRVDAPPLGGPTSDSFTLTAQSVGDDALTLTAAGTTSYGLEPGLATSGADSQIGVWGQVLTYTIAVTNTGNYTDTFAIEIGESSWPTSSATAVTGPLAPGAIGTVEVYVLVGNGRSDAVTIRFTSALDDTVWDEEVVLTSSTNLLFLPLVIGE